MDERLRFVARLLEGENMSRVCREFGISRPTGYKIFSRYKDLGYQGLLDRSRRPYRHANQLPFQLESAIVRLRTEHPSWGAAKIREKLIRAFPMVPAPAKSTVHAVLDRQGLVERRKRRRYKAQGTSLSDPKKEATRPGSFNFLQQRSRFDEFIEVYNHQRPHAAIGMRYPGEIYTPSPRPSRDSELPQYPFHDRSVCVTRCGRTCIGKRKINPSQVFSGQLVGIREVEEKIWLV
jgi:transposase